MQKASPVPEDYNNPQLNYAREPNRTPKTESLLVAEGWDSAMDRIRTNLRCITECPEYEPCFEPSSPNRNVKPTQTLQADSPYASQTSEIPRTQSSSPELHPEIPPPENMQEPTAWCAKAQT